jgi:hypothetical protein
MLQHTLARCPTAHRPCAHHSTRLPPCSQEASTLGSAVPKPNIRRDDIGLGSMADLRSFATSLGERPKTPLQLNETELLMQESPAPSSFAKRQPKHTEEALKLHHSREHLGMHPYRVVLSEVCVCVGGVQHSIMRACWHVLLSGVAQHLFLAVAAGRSCELSATCAACC